MGHNVGGVWVYYRAIKAFLNWYWREMEPDMRNPIDAVKLPQVRVKAKKGVPIADFERLLDACKLQRDRAILQCLLDSGCRASEFCDLNIGDVDMLSGRVWVRAGKGDKARVVRFGDKARKELRRYLKGREHSRDDPLFATDEGGRFNRNSLRLLMERRAADADVPCPGLHDFRRLCGYLMHRNGASVREIQLYLGHSSITVTQRYIALDDDDIMDAHRRASPVDNWRI